MPTQLGFRRNISTVLAVESLFEKILHYFEGRVHVVLCNLLRAFDCIPHRVLLTQLKQYVLGDCALRVVSSYLANRM